jgi:hypothetical protein
MWGLRTRLDCDRKFSALICGHSDQELVRKWQVPSDRSNNDGYEVLRAKECRKRLLSSFVSSTPAGRATSAGVGPLGWIVCSSIVLLQPDVRAAQLRYVSCTWGCGSLLLTLVLRAGGCRPYPGCVEPAANRQPAGSSCFPSRRWSIAKRVAVGSQACAHHVRNGSSIALGSDQLRSVLTITYAGS